MANNKDFESIIKEITGGLIGESEKDIEYLKNQMEKYKDHEFGKEIIRACGRMMYALIPEDKKEDLIDVINKNTQGFAQVLDEAKFCIYKKDYDKALRILEDMVNKYEDMGMYENDAVSEYYCFSEPMQEILYVHYNKPEKDIRKSQIDYAALYFLYGNVLVELGKVKEAREALEKARRWNPTSPEIGFEYAETFKMEGDVQSFAKVTREFYPYIMTNKDLARFYRNMGFYFVEVKEYFAAVCCLMYSTGFEKSNMVPTELYYIEQTTGENYNPSVEEMLLCFEEHDIPLRASEDVLGIAYTYGKHFYEEVKDMEATAYFWGIFDELQEDEEIKKVLEEIKECSD